MAGPTALRDVDVAPRGGAGRAQGLLVKGDREASLLARVECLEADLRKALEARELAQRELQESQAMARMLWTKAHQRGQELARSRGRKRRWGGHWLRWRSR
jgi:type II secretory pathway component PulL